MARKESESFEKVNKSLQQELRQQQQQAQDANNQVLQAAQAAERKVDACEEEAAAYQGSLKKMQDENGSLLISNLTFFYVV